MYMYIYIYIYTYIHTYIHTVVVLSLVSLAALSSSLSLVWYIDGHIFYGIIGIFYLYRPYHIVWYHWYILSIPAP